MLASSRAAAGSESSLQPAEVEPRLGHRQPADEVRGELVGLHRPEHRADLVDQRQPDGVLRRGQLDQPRRPSSLAASASAEQVLEQEDLDAALAHPGDELVVLVLGALDPQHVVEQQVVVVGRASAAAGSAPAGAPSPCAACRPPSGPRTLPSLLPSRRGPQAGTTWVPALPSTIASMSSRRRSRRACPVASTNRARRLDLRAHRPGRERHARAARLAVTRSRRRCSGVPQSGVDAVDVGGHHEQVGVDLAGEQLAGEVLVDDRLDADERRARLRVVTWSGTPPPPAQMTTTSWSSSQRIGRISKMRCGSGDGTTRRQYSPSCLKIQPFSAASSSACCLVVDRARRTWSGRRRPGRPGRPRPSSGCVANGSSAAVGCRAPARGRSRSSPAVCAPRTSSGYGLDVGVRRGLQRQQADLRAVAVRRAPAGAAGPRPPARARRCARWRAASRPSSARPASAGRCRRGPRRRASATSGQRPAWRP